MHWTWSLSSLCDGIWIRKKRNEKKITASCLGNTIDWAGKLFGEMIVLMATCCYLKFSLCDFLINFPLIFSKRDRDPFQIIWSNDSFILKILRIDPCGQMEQDLWAGSRFWTSRVLLHCMGSDCSFSLYIYLVESSYLHVNFWLQFFLIL